jgi:hypothetical protein
MHTIPKLWDTATLKARTQDAIACAEGAQSEQDWQRATIYAERALSDKGRRFQACRLPACRRARGCRGNPAICLPASAGESAGMGEAIDRIYVQIQQQRRRAALLGRRLDMLDPATRKLRRRK